MALYAPPRLERASSIERSRKYPLHCNDDIYEAVVKASFGGYRFLGITPGEESLSTRPVHPAFVFAFAAVLVFVQVYLIFALTVNSFDTSRRIDVQDEGDNFLRLGQIMCIFLVQLTVFKELEQSLHMLIFLLNPFTWDWLQEVEPERSREVHETWFWSKPVVYPLSVVALGFKVFVAVLTSASCSSVILECDSVENVIFNGLANLFLLEVDEHMFTFVRSIFSIEDRPRSDDYSFDFQLRSDEEVLDILQRQQAGEWYVQSGKWMLKHRRPVWWVSRTLQFFILYLVYARQLFIVSIAFDTDTLPSARDVCAIKRMTKRWLGISLENLTDGLNKSLRHFCSEEGSGRMGPVEAWSILIKYPLPLISMLVFLFLVLMLPQLVRAFLGAELTSEDDDAPFIARSMTFNNRNSADELWDHINDRFVEQQERVEKEHTDWRDKVVQDLMNQWEAKLRDALKEYVKEEILQDYVKEERLQELAGKLQQPSGGHMEETITETQIIRTRCMVRSERPAETSVECLPEPRRPLDPGGSSLTQQQASGSSSGRPPLLQAVEIRGSKETQSGPPAPGGRALRALESSSLRSEPPTRPQPTSLQHVSRTTPAAQAGQRPRLALTEGRCGGSQVGPNLAPAVPRGQSEPIGPASQLSFSAWPRFQSTPSARALASHDLTHPLVTPPTWQPRQPRQASPTSRQV